MLRVSLDKNDLTESYGENITHVQRLGGYIHKVYGMIN